MSRNIAILFIAGLGIMGALVAGVLLMQRGARLGLTGEMPKIRTTAPDPNSTIAIIDFRVVNPSDVEFMVENVNVFMEENDGKKYEGKIASEIDSQRLFEGLPILGQKFNPVMTIRDKIAPRSTADRMVAVRFEAPEARIQARKRFLLRIEEFSGPVSEISEK
jgi:hypothetical protein